MPVNCGYKRRILIVSYSMGIGGVERALLGLLYAIDYSQVEVTLRLARKQGDLLREIPKEVCVEQIDSIYDNWELFNKPLVPQIFQRLKKPETFFSGLRVAHDFLWYKVQGHYHRLFTDLLDKDSEYFDLAVSYAGPSSLLDYYVANCVNATKKVSWIHYDLSKFSINKKSLRSLYSSFDKIFVVSEDGKNIFDSTFPEFKSKGSVFHNLINPSEIIRLATPIHVPVLPKEGINCLMVGRLSSEKGQDLAIEAISKLKSKGIDVNLTLVGEGKFRPTLETLCMNLEVKDRVRLIGATQNPYPYMALCDIYLQTSRHEGYCITLAEARLFGMPIVATNFTGAREQLSEYKTGFIASHDSEEIANRIQDIIRLGLYKTKNPTDGNIDSDYHKLAELLI